MAWIFLTSFVWGGIFSTSIPEIPPAWIPHLSWPLIHFVWVMLILGMWAWSTKTSTTLLILFAFVGGRIWNASPREKSFAPCQTLYRSPGNFPTAYVLMREGANLSIARLGDKEDGHGILRRIHDDDPTAATPRITWHHHLTLNSGSFFHLYFLRIKNIILNLGTNIPPQLAPWVYMVLLGRFDETQPLIKHLSMAGVGSTLVMSAALYGGACWCLRWCCLVPLSLLHGLRWICPLRAQTLKKHLMGLWILLIATYAGLIFAPPGIQRVFLWQGVRFAVPFFFSFAKPFSQRFPLCLSLQALCFPVGFITMEEGLGVAAFILAYSEFSKLNHQESFLKRFIFMILMHMKFTILFFPFVHEVKGYAFFLSFFVYAFARWLWLLAVMALLAVQEEHARRLIACVAHFVSEIEFPTWEIGQKTFHFYDLTQHNQWLCLLAAMWILMGAIHKSLFQRSNV